MKKQLLVLILLVVITVLTACNNTAPVSPTDEAEDTPKTTLELLESAGEKLRTAQSFNLGMWEWESNYWNVIKIEDLDTFSLESEPTTKFYEMQYVANLDGSPVSYTIQPDISNPEETNDWYYFYGETGYSVHNHNTNYKHICDDASSNDWHFWFLNNAIDIRNTALFENFCELEPSVTTAENGYIAISAHLTSEQLCSLLGVALPMYTSSEIEAPIGYFYPDTEDPKELSLEFIIDPQGYLRQIQVKKWKPLKDETNFEYTYLVRSISFSDINEKIDIKAPSLATDYLKNPEQKYCIAHHFDGDYQAIYSYDSEKNVYNYSFIEKNLSQDVRPFNNYQTTPAYRLLTEIDNIVVQADYKLANPWEVSTCYADNLIIPKGMVFVYGWYYLDGSDRLLGNVYFEDPEETASFVLNYTSIPDRVTQLLSLKEVKELLGYISIEDRLKNVYYAGEWEYVDGIPMPIQ